MYTAIGILLAAPADKNAKIAELIAPLLSGMAFILSAAAFIFTVIIQLKERRRNIRQTLSTALSDLARINVEVSMLRKDEKDSTPEIILIRKNYNSQRGTLVSNADFLMNENNKIITDADCELMALTYDDLGDIKKAEEYWLSAINLAYSAAQRHLHQRDYAAFLFNNNRPQAAREYFEKALQVNLSGTDDDVRHVADTFLIWAQLEQNFGDEKEFSRLVDESNVWCEKIQHKRKKQEMAKLVATAGQQ